MFLPLWVSPDDSSVISPDAVIVTLPLVLTAIATSVHRDEQVKLPEAGLVGEIARLYGEFIGRMTDPTDLGEAKALLPWLEDRIRKCLREARSEPGTGKRSA